MKTLKLYEVGVDPLPVDGISILVFDKNTSYGMFEQHFTKEGKVCYMYGDIADSLEEAYYKGGYITTDWREIRDWDEESLAISIDVGDEATLTDGLLWMYCHEYYPVISNMFPFQDWEEYCIAKREGWIEELEYIEDEREFIKDGVDIRFDESVIEFDGKVYYLKWIGREGYKSLMDWRGE